MVDTKYTVVLDSDCTFLSKDWDDFLIRQLTDKIKIIGTPLSRGRSGLKPNDFPFQFAVLFETEVYKKLKISCMPRDISKGEDTCWEWKPKFINNGYEGKIFVAQSTRDFKNTPFKDIICVIYYSDDKKIIASHFGRGSSGATFKYYHKWYFNIPLFSSIIRKYVAVKEKKYWIDTCYRIIDNQKNN
jgi:hypothetical protein